MFKELKNIHNHPDQI